MTPLDALRRQQHEEALTPSDAQLIAFLTGVDPATAALEVALDHAAHASPREIRMIGARRGWGLA